MDHVPHFISPTSAVGDLRASLKLTLAEMGARCGISKSQMHEVERTGRASLTVALAIESLSEGALDAATLNGDVRRAREVHAGMDNGVPGIMSPGNSQEIAHDSDQCGGL